MNFKANKEFEIENKIPAFQNELTLLRRSSRLFNKKTYCFKPETSNFNILNTKNNLNFEEIKNYFNEYNYILDRA